jgi:hypothetical protein
MTNELTTVPACYQPAPQRSHELSTQDDRIFQRWAHTKLWMTRRHRRRPAGRTPTKKTPLTSIVQATAARTFNLTATQRGKKEAPRTLTQYLCPSYNTLNQATRRLPTCRATLQDGAPTTSTAPSLATSPELAAHRASWCPIWNHAPQPPLTHSLALIDPMHIGEPPRITFRIEGEIGREAYSQKRAAKGWYAPIQKPAGAHGASFMQKWHHDHTTARRIKWASWSRRADWYFRADVYPSSIAISLVIWSVLNPMAAEARTPRRKATS